MSSFDIEFAAVTDIGKIREKNEDNVLISSALGLGVVADGMGGHSAGEVASSIAVSVLAETIRKINNTQLQIPDSFLPKLCSTTLYQIFFISYLVANVLFSVCFIFLPLYKKYFSQFFIKCQIKN